MKQFSIISLVCMSFMFAACANAVVDSKTTEISVNADSKSSKIVSQPEPTAVSNEESPIANSKECQQKNIPQSADLEETIKAPESREQFNDWLNNMIGSVQVATLPNRKFINEYYWEGDLNNDGCRDIAILVEGVQDKSGAVSTEGFASGTTVQNLRSGAIYRSGDAAQIPFSKTFALQVKPQQKTAVAIIFGGQKGWSWKNNATGREFLLYDAVFTLPKAADDAAAATLFSIVDKSKPEKDDDDLLELFPLNAVGDCIYTATEVKRPKNEYSELINKSLICYDGKAFFSKKLPDSRSYPEI